MLHLYYFERRKFYAHVLHLDLFELSKATYEISPKVIDIQEGYNKIFMKIIGENKLDSL
jgi:hypothetical protein